MAINFPTSLDVFTDPTSSDQLNSPSHSGQHADLNNAVEALEAKVGINSSAVTSSHDYKIAQLEAGATGGKILQVVTATQSTPVSTTSTSFVTANLSATITPSAVTSKVLIVCQFSLANYITSGSGGNTGSSAQIDRGGTSLAITTLERAGASAAGTALRAPMSLIYLDNPSTTSATTYNTTIRSDNAGYTTVAHYSGNIVSGGSETHLGSITLLEVAA